MGALVDESERVTDCVLRREGDRSFVYSVSSLHEVDDEFDDVEWNVLRQHGESATPCDSLCHASSGNRCHVCHHDGDRGTESIGRAEIDIEPAGH